MIIEEAGMFCTSPMETSQFKLKQEAKATGHAIQYIETGGCDWPINKLPISSGQNLI